eukprot:2042173-Rhodomonas_salina.1
MIAPNPILRIRRSREDYAVKSSLPLQPERLEREITMAFKFDLLQQGMHSSASGVGTLWRHEVN